jgi:hypothetical protein
MTPDEIANIHRDIKQYSADANSAIRHIQNLLEYVALLEGRCDSCEWCQDHPKTKWMPYRSAKTPEWFTKWLERRCIDCLRSLDGTVHLGAGSGDGQRFRCEPCHLKAGRYCKACKRKILTPGVEVCGFCKEDLERHTDIRSTPSGHLYQMGVSHDCGVSGCPANVRRNAP